MRSIRSHAIGIGPTLRRVATAAKWAALRLFLINGPGDYREAARKSSISDRKIALVAHVYYRELLPEILAVYERMPPNCVLFITTTFDNAATMEADLGGSPSTQVRAFENRGRDIAPFVLLLQSGVLADFDVVLKIHTKRSLHLPFGDLLRKATFKALAGGGRRVDRIIRLFDEPSVGLVGWRRLFMTAPRHWRRNQANVEAILSALSVKRGARLAFFGGSMFWFRPAALASLAANHYRLQDFEAEAGQIDGTLHHAMERCFTILAADSGFRTLDTRGQILWESDELRDGLQT